MKKQSAIDWLIKEFNIQNYPATIQFAKDMEKSQILDAYHSGRNDFQMRKECQNQEVSYINDAHEYYNEKYDNKNSLVNLW
jgi:cupin superfamily acireductone dioxygenase involved in methionine salvage